MRIKVHPKILMIVLVLWITAAAWFSIRIERHDSQFMPIEALNDKSHPAYQGANHPTAKSKN